VDNLKRHVLTKDYLDMPKASGMAIHTRLVSDADVHPIQEKFDTSTAERFAKPDVIACCADSDLCCQLVNDYSLREGIPAAYGAVWGAAETAEIITVFPKITPCYACYEREGPAPEPSMEKYTDPNYDSTKMPHQEGLWCDVLMAASVQFRAILKVFQVKERIFKANKAQRERGVFYGCFGELWADMNPLILTSLRPPYGSEIIRQKQGCAVCSENMEGLRI